MTAKKEVTKKAATPAKTVKKAATPKVAEKIQSQLIYLQGKSEQKSKVVKKATKMEVKTPDKVIVDNLKADKFTKTGDLLTVTIQGKVKMIQTSNKTEQNQIKEAFQTYYKDKTKANQKKLEKLLETPVAKKEVLKKSGKAIKEAREETKAVSKELAVESKRKSTFKDFTNDLKEKIESTNDEVIELKKQLEALQRAIKKLEKVPDYSEIVIRKAGENYESYRRRMEANNVPTNLWRY